MSVVINIPPRVKISVDRRLSSVSVDVPFNCRRKRRSEANPRSAAAKRKMSLPMSLRDFLKKKSRVQAFRAFLRKEFSDENLDFWLEIESYRKRKQAKQMIVSRVIYETFIQRGAARELNIDVQTRKETENRLSRPDSMTFDPAQEQVLILMETDSYRRFLVQSWNSSVEKEASKSAGAEVGRIRFSFPRLRFTLTAGTIERRRKSIAAQ